MTLEISYYSRMDGLRVSTDVIAEPGSRPPQPPTGDRVAIMYSFDLGIFWGFDGKWHKAQPREWDELDEISELEQMFAV